MRRRLDDAGSALMMVLGAMMILTIIVTVAVSAAIQTSSTARHSTEWNAALAAAEAGVDDYLARLNKKDDYWKSTPDCTNVAMQVPKPALGCGWTTSTPVGWVRVPGADRAEFHYDVVTTKTPSTGTVDVTSTGRVGDVTRTTRTVLRRGGFGEFLYYTVYETLDPADEVQFGLNNTTAQASCTKYRWQRTWDGCVNINFVTGDKINGPMHTNDGMQIKGTPAFKGTVTTSYPNCKNANGTPAQYNKCYYVSGSAAPAFDKGISHRDEIALPTSIGDLRPFVASTRPDAGCLYTGPTRIQFLAPSGGAYSKMKVWSPHSKSALNPGCGNHTAAWPQTLDLPHNRLVLVQDVPSSQSLPASGACALGSIGGFPQEGDVALTLNESSCRYGTLYVEGRLTGRVTLAADNNVVITGDLTYAGGKTGLDALGLIAQNSVKIYHPYGKTCNVRNAAPSTTCRTWSSGSSNLVRPESGTVFLNAKVHAAILTLQHSFTVQTYASGNSLGTLTLFGTIAQRFRGPVGQDDGSVMHGYLKDYEYDTRMRYAPPPYFLDPVRSAWGVKAYGESEPAY